MKNTQTNSGCNLLTDPFGRYLAGLGRPLLAVGFWVDDTVLSNIKYLVRKPPLSFFWNKIVFHFSLPHTYFLYLSRDSHEKLGSNSLVLNRHTEFVPSFYSLLLKKWRLYHPRLLVKTFYLIFFVDFILRYPFFSYRALTLNSLSFMCYYSSRIGRDIYDSRPPFVQTTRRIWEVCDHITCDSVPIP